MSHGTETLQLPIERWNPYFHLGTNEISFGNALWNNSAASSDNTLPRSQDEHEARLANTDFVFFFFFFFFLFFPDLLFHAASYIEPKQ